MSPAGHKRCGLLADEASQLLYLKDALLSGDRLAQRRAIVVVAAGRGGVLLAGAIEELLRRTDDS
jgi:NADH dehydrogenase FAD-containing subunit